MNFSQNGSCTQHLPRTQERINQQLNTLPVSHGDLTSQSKDPSIFVIIARIGQQRLVRIPIQPNTASTSNRSSHRARQTESRATNPTTSHSGPLPCCFPHQRPFLWHGHRCSSRASEKAAFFVRTCDQVGSLAKKKLVNSEVAENRFLFHDLQEIFSRHFYSALQPITCREAPLFFLCALSRRQCQSTCQLRKASTKTNWVLRSTSSPLKKGETTPSSRGQLSFKRWCTPSFRPSELYAKNKEAHKRKEETPQIRRKHAMFKV